MRKPKSKEFWISEAEFIEAEAKKDNPMACFGSYCAMQARFAEQDGCHEESQRIITAGEKA